MTRFFSHIHRPCLTLALLAAPVWALAQAVPEAPGQAWRQANDQVGQLQRGHVDVLKWERSHGTAVAAVEPPLSAAGLSLPDAETAVRLAWRAHRELAQPLARLGARNVNVLASGPWSEVDPSLFWRVPDFAEVLEVAAQARKAWTQAVAAQQTLTHVHAARNAAEAAHELGARMVGVGNWSKLQSTQVQLTLANANMAVQRAQLAVHTAQARLLDALQLSGEYTAVVVPQQLPGLPNQAMPRAEFKDHLARIQAQLPTRNRLQHVNQASLGYETYLASHAIALSSRDEVQAVRAFITEETVLHYNGMLKSTWDLLGAAHSQSQAVASAVAAQRDFNIAQIDLQWVLLGGMPPGFVPLNDGNAESAAPAGH